MGGWNDTFTAFDNRLLHGYGAMDAVELEVQACIVLAFGFS